MIRPSLRPLAASLSAFAALLLELAVPRQAHADLQSDARAAAGVISNYLQGVTQVLGNSVIQKQTGDAIDLTTQALLTQAALKDSTQAQLEILVDGTSLVFILNDLISLDGGMRAAAAGDSTKAGSLLTASKDIWDLFWILATRTGMQAGGGLPSGGFLTAFSAANYIVGYEFFIVGQVLNLELSVVDYGRGVIAGAMELESYAKEVLFLQQQEDPRFFSNTEKAILNDYAIRIAPGNPTMNMLRTNIGIASLGNRTNSNVFDVTANYPGLIPGIPDPENWTIGASARLGVTNGQKHLQIGLWTYTGGLGINDANGRDLPRVAVQFLTNGAWSTFALGTVSNLWSVSSSTAQSDHLYGPKRAPTLDIALPPNTRLPSEVQTVWSFPGAPDITNLTVYRFAELQVQSPNRSGDTLTAYSGTSRHVFIPLALSSTLAVTNLQASLTALNTTNNPPIVATNLQWHFSGWPANLAAGQTVTTPLELEFPTNTPPGTYSGLLQLDALNASPVTLAVSVIVSAGLSDGLVAYYPFNGNANDASGYGNHGTPQGGLAFVSGRNGMVAQFDGMDDFVEAPSSDSLNLTNAATLSCWFKTAAPNVENAGLLNKVGVTDRNGYLLFLNPNAGAPPGSTCGADFNYEWPTQVLGVHTSVPVQNGRWHQLTVTYDGQFGRIFVDGAVSAVSSTPFLKGSKANSLPLTIGWDRASGQPTTRHFNGLLDDVRIYNRSLSEDEIQHLYVTEGGLSAGLVAYYPFDGNANDASGNEHHGMTHGDVAFVDGRLGQAARLSYSWIEIENFLNSVTAFSIALWVKEEGMVEAQTGGDAEAGEGLVFFGDATTGWAGIASWGGGWAGVGLANEVITESVSASSAEAHYSYVVPKSSWRGVWHHCLQTYDPGSQSVCLFIDGRLVDIHQHTKSATASFAAIGSHTWEDGTGHSWRFFGNIDDVRIYNRALSASEVWQLYTLDWPTLGAVRQAGSLIFSWPTNSSALTLVSATNLAPPVLWTAISPAPSSVNGHYVVTNSVSGPARFFRLQGP